MSPFLVKGDDISPIIHLRLNNSYDHLTRDEEETLLQKFVDKVLSKSKSSENLRIFF